MTVSTEQIRIILGNPSEETIPGEVIAQSILDAKRYVENATGVSSGPLFDLAVRYRAAYLTLVAYSDALVRSVGPRGIEALLDQVKSLYQEAMTALGRPPADEKRPVAIAPELALTDSAWDDEG